MWYGSGVSIYVYICIILEDVFSKENQLQQYYDGEVPQFVVTWYHHKEESSVRLMQNNQPSININIVAGDNFYSLRFSSINNVSLVMFSLLWNCRMPQSVKSCCCCFWAYIILEIVSWADLPIDECASWEQSCVLNTAITPNDRWEAEESSFFNCSIEHKMLLYIEKKTLPFVYLSIMSCTWRTKMVRLHFTTYWIF
jgi:hypothetical protein